MCGVYVNVGCCGWGGGCVGGGGGGGWGWGWMWSGSRLNASSARVENERCLKSICSFVLMNVGILMYRVW